MEEALNLSSDRILNDDDDDIYIYIYQLHLLCIFVWYVDIFRTSVRITRGCFLKEN